MLKVLELYSGIGGFHYALEESQIPHQVVAAADINNVANDIYRHNFSTTKIMQRCIEVLTVKELDQLSPDLIHMSPPCQPFVRVGKQQDADDRRTKSFLHLIGVIPLMKKQPQYVFLENVKGFDTSETREILLSMLKESGYTCQEFLLSPLQFGVPNSRLRYYLLAKLKPLKFDFEISHKIMEDLPLCARPHLRHRRGCHGHHVNHIVQEKTPGKDAQEDTTGSDAVEDATGSDVHEGTTLSSSVTNVHQTRNNVPSSSLPSKMVPMETDNGIDESEAGGQSDVDNKRTTIATHDTELRDGELPAELGAECDNSNLTVTESPGSRSGSSDSSVPLYQKCQDMCRPLLDYLEAGPDDYLERFMVPPKFLRRFWVMDIVKANSKHTCCFTKRYAHHIEGAGSVIQTAKCPDVDLIQYKRDHLYTAEVERGVESLRLRFFTPREIANLMCFPTKFEFPQDVSTIQCYRVLGNSLNVHVVSVLLRLLVDPHPS